MKNYQQHLSALESIHLYIERERDEFGFTPDMLDELDQTAQEMLETIKLLEDTLRQRDTLQLKEWGYLEEEETEEQRRLWEEFLDRCKKARGNNV